MSERKRVVIAGGGVAGLEAMLALRDLLGERVRVEVLAPETEFTYRQFAVAEPFSMGEVARFDLGELVEGAGAVHRRDALASVNPGARTVGTTAGAEIPYDDLVVAVGARAIAAVPGAETYAGPVSNPFVREATLKLAGGESRGLILAVPATVHWSLPAYELALMAAAHLADIGAAGAPVHIVTPERRPLDVFGAAVSDRIAELLAENAVEFHTRAPARVVEGGLATMDGGLIAGDHVIALPAYEVQGIPGLAQGPHGFIDTDSRMRVQQAPGVYVAGDASWFPIKQGGLAAQEADVVAAAIAHELDPEIESEPFRPQLRAALLTADGPLYLRRGEGLATAASEAPLWWPPGKVAGRYLTPYVASRASATNQPDPALVDLEEAAPEDVADHREATELALHAAEADARLGDYQGALRWLAVAERLDLTLSAEHALNREQWRRLAG